ncbi:MAG TPA: hypothetical protein DCM40_25510 [Maribacter sp.]|uniref:hypothetical protein n=1 Tax=Maribacter sp. UBA4516 TaxID=1946804 RepID=UPI000ED57761|nr:hypothetical protein [Maribacter sp. UBA4516]HAI41224.1 hypothetical protein [Maribacter sp.]
MRIHKKNKLFSLIPALWASLFDAVITISHQSEEYWNGNLNMANEGNPIGAFIMKSHSSGIFILCGLWLILIGILGFYLPKKISKIFLLFVLMVHTWGASSWILNEYGFWLIIIFILFNAILFYQIQDLTEQNEESYSDVK